VRYNQKGKVLYATVLGAPSTDVSLKLLGKKKSNAAIKSIKVLGSKEKLSWKQYPDSLVIQKPKIIPNNIAVVFKIQQ
jgi:alpha-L-fucosidase